MGFKPNQLVEAFHHGVKVVPRDPSETIPLIGRALEAVERAVRQMPDEKLDWSIPKRKRPMREFTCHIFNHVQNAMEELSGGGVSARPDVLARSYTSFQDIADYGRSIIEQYRSWTSKQDLDVLHTPPPAGSNARSGAERLDLAAGQTIHHLRQLYSILENFGITPENRLEDREFPPEYVLTTLW